MKIAIHHSKISYSKYWIAYCEGRDIPYKIVDCYKSDIIQQIADCDALMWHHYHRSEKDTLFAKQLLYSVEMSGKRVFPDFNTSWHFDDKVGQKYLLEAVGAPLVPSYVFYTKYDCLSWIKEASFPKVFKLRSGSGSANVRLVKTRRDAIRLANKAFARGFSQYDSVGSLMERWRKFREGKLKFREVFEGFLRIFKSTPYSTTHGKERGYIYFQDFIPGNTHDIRVNYVNHRCFASRRKVRPGDFRASGSGIIDLNMTEIPEKALKIAFDVSTKLNLQTAAFDFVIYNGEPLIVEVSYGFGYPENQFELGYWDEELTYYPGSFNPFGWIVDGVLARIDINNR